MIKDIEMKYYPDGGWEGLEWDGMGISGQGGLRKSTT